MTNPAEGTLTFNETWAFDVNDTIGFNGTVYHYSPISTYAYCYVPGLDIIIVLLFLISVFLGTLMAMRLYYFLKGDAR